MNRWSRAVISAGVIVVIGVTAHAAPPLWRVKGLKGSAVLFGSIHLLPAGMNWRTSDLTDAVATADEIWFEIPIGGRDDQRAASLLLRRGSLPRGETLAAHVTPEMLRRLNLDAIQLGLSPVEIDGMRPWLADATLSLASDGRSGALASEGVERQVAAIAPATAHQHALESARDQVTMLADGSMAEQIDLLGVTLDEIERQPKEYRTVVDAWVAGNTAALREEALDPLMAASPRAFRVLITNRNQRWSKEIARRLTHPGRIVVVVGVGHLLGPGGVPVLLQAAGLAVDEPIQ